jgi:Spy/CpxP family protein refolding chaperone/peroxiredoxin
MESVMRNKASIVSLRGLLLSATLGVCTLSVGSVYAGDAGSPATTEGRRGQENRGPGTREPGARGPMRDLMPILQSLELTQEQRQAIRPIIEAAAKQLREETTDETIAAEERRNMARAILSETQQNISDQLSAEQREKFETAIAELKNQRAAEKSAQRDESRKAEQANRQQRAKPNAQGRAVFRELAGALQELGLSDDQREQVREIVTTAGAELRELMQDDSKRNGDRAGFANELIASAKRDIDAVLTPEQREQFDPKFKQIIEMARQQREAGGRRATEERTGEERTRQQAGEGAARATQPSDRPEAERNQGERRQSDRGAMMLNRLQESIEKLGLDEGQKKQADEVLTTVRSKLRALRDNTNEADPQALRRRAREIFEDGMLEIRGILTPDQAQRLREMMRPPGEEGGPRPGAPRDGGPRDSGPRDSGPREGPPKGPPKDNNPPPPMNDNGDGMSGPMNGPMTGSSESPKDSPRADEQNSSPASGVNQNDKNNASDGRIFGGDPADGSTQLVEIGDAVPAFSLNRLDGRVVTLDSLKGKPAVLLFGSYTSPSFRQRAVQFQELAQSFDMKVQFVVIYTAEAHPKGQWQVERNVQEEIEVESHADLDARFAAARIARDKLKLSSDVLPVAPDKMDDHVSAMLGGFPNGLAVIDKDGKLYARQRWADPFATQTHLESLLSGK